MRNRSIRWGILLVFWLATYPVLLSTFSSDERYFVDYLYTVLFWFTLMLPALVSEAWLRSRWLTKARYLGFLALWTSLVFLGAFFNDLFFSRLVDLVLPGYYFISYYDYWDIVKFFAAFLALSTLVGTSIDWFQLQATLRHSAILAKEKSDAEFQALSNQLHPHFLFNSLAVIHSMAVQKKPETPSAVLHLSDLLRYVVYRSAGTVSLDEELKILDDYIELQRFRVHPSTQIVVRRTGETYGWKLAPMLLLPLLENAFKHGVQSKTDDARVEMTVHTDDEEFVFELRNTFGHQVPSVDSKSGGIGLASVQKRLELMYPARHSFSTTRENDLFTVLLRIRRDSIYLE